MSFKYETQYNSPNYTTPENAQRTWGQPYAVRAIAIHWWGDPNTNPSYEGVINGLVSPTRGASAHFIATGTRRRVAQLIDLRNASWATNSANPWTVSIECDPRCREEDYDVVAELIANIRSVYGNIPLVPHRQFVATQCPGNYNLAELDRRANLKDGSGDWGVVTDKNVTPPAPITSRDQIAAAYLEVLERAFDEGGMQTYLKSGFGIDRIKSEMRGSQEYKDIQARKAAQVVVPPVVVPAPTPETPPKPIEEPSKPSETETGTTKPSDTETALQSLVRALKAFWTILVNIWKS